MSFDPKKPFQVEGSGGFDPSKPFEVDAEPPTRRTTGREIGRQVGLTGRSVLNAAASLPLTALEGGAGVANLLNRSVGREGNFSFMDQWESVLNRYLPKPETDLEKGVQVVGSMIAGARMPGQSPLPNRAVTGADRAIAEGVRRQVPVYYDDVGGAMAKKAGVAAEQLGPLGTGSGRAVQAQATKAAASELVGDYATASDDVPVLIQKGLTRRLAGLKKGAGALYKRADTALASSGDVDLTNFRATIAARIKAEERLGDAANKDTIATLQKYLNAPAGDFALMRQLRSALGDDISAYYTGKGAGAIGSKGVDSLQAAKSAIDDAMGQHAKKVGGSGYAAWKQADSFYRTNIVPFKEAGFKDLVKTAEPEKAWRYLLANNTESRAVRMLNGLDRQGRAAVKYGLVREAMDTATDPKGNFSPAKFAKYLEDHDSAVNTFFKGAERQDIDGFRNLMRHVERAGQFAENPPTGQRVIPWLVGGAAFMEPNVAAGVAGGGLTVRALFQTNTGRNMLMAASRIKPGTPEMERMLERITRYAASGATAAQASDGAQ
jgi:hypothetical protein